MSGALRASLAVVALVLSLCGTAALAQSDGAPQQAYAHPEFSEPVTLSSVDGVLEVTLTARQGEARIDTASRPVKNALLYSYRLVRGEASNGEATGDDLYPGPTLNVYPGETLIIHYENGLTGLTVRDFYDPIYVTAGGIVPIYPEQLGESPINLHTHGLHVSPKGNADNVLLHMPGGTANTFIYNVPTSMPQGAYWYHPHLHTLTSAHVYYGLAGLLAIGRTDGNLPQVTEKAIPIRNMVLQYNFVFDRQGPNPQFNNPYWQNFVNTTIPPAGDELAAGTYRPLLTPVNFFDSAKGTEFATVWYAGEQLSPNNDRGRFQFIPNSLQAFTAADGPEDDRPIDPSFPDHLRDVQYTVNGQFQPTIRIKPGQTEIWVLANMSDVAYLNLRLTETATGRHKKFAIVGQDGNPSPAVGTPPTDGGTRLMIPPATRFAIAVTMPDEGDLVLEMAEIGDGQRTVNSPGILYTHDGTGNPPAKLGTLSVLPSGISYFDGFFLFPTQILARAVPDEGHGTTTEFTIGEPLGAFTSFVDLSGVTPDLTRRILIDSGVLNNLASDEDAKSFVYSFDSQAFPNVPLIQPRLGSVEEWVFSNVNNDEHPIHIHVNDFQITSLSDPATGLVLGPQMQGIDNANVPAPNIGPGEVVIQPGLLSVRTLFEDYAGLFVMHCHRLNHEDNGLMAMVNVIPAVSSYAVAIPGAAGQPATVRLFDGKGDKPIATVTPFPGFEGTISVAMGDVDGDGVYDLVVGAGAGYAPDVAVFSGAARDGAAAFATELARFTAFDPAPEGGVSVAAAQIDGSAQDNIVVGSGPGTPSEVKVFSSELPSVGAAPAVFSSFSPYPDDQSGVTLATGFVDFTTGRQSIVTAPGPGAPATVKVFVFPLLTAIGGGHSHGQGSDAATLQPVTTTSFSPFGDGYRGGVSLATGWLAGVLGGAERIVVGQHEGGVVKVFSSGSALDGGPAMYLHRADAHQHASFREVASFAPFGESAGGVSVATTSTTEGADLLVGALAADGKASVRRFEFVRPDKTATFMTASSVGEVAVEGAGSVTLGGD